MKVIFAGTPDFAAAALREIVAAGIEVSLVLTQPDRPSGRGMKLQPSAVKVAALELGLPVMQPQTLKDGEVQELLVAEQADVMVVAAYGLLLPKAVLDIPTKGCLNIHASLLPRWRGAAPIQRAIEAGDNETGVCIMQMDVGLDTGDVLLQKKYTIKASDTANEVHDALMNLGSTAIVTTLQQLDALVPVQQPDEGVTYAQKLSKTEAQLDWSESAIVLERKIRAFNPVPTAWMVYEGKPLKVWKAQVVDANGEAGSILSADENGLVIATGNQALSISELQPAGSKRMNISAFLAGRIVNVGDKLA